MNIILSWIINNWFGVIILLVFIGLIISDIIKKRKQTEAEKKQELLETAKRITDVKYVGDNKEYVTINADRVDVADFLNVYLNMEKEGYVYDQNLNEFSEFDTLVFMRKKK